MSVAMLCCCNADVLWSYDGCGTVMICYCVVVCCRWRLKRSWLLQ